MLKYLLAVFMFSTTVAASAQEALHVMTFNIRYDNPGDSLDAWPHRKEFVASQISFHNVQLLGVQEALQHQVDDLAKRLPGYSHIGVGRDDGREKGEYSAIFYDSGRLQLKQWGTFWLSETPSIAGSKGWDAAITRLVTWAQFTDKAVGKSFFAFNTHFDHMGQVARRESARLLLNQVQSIAGNVPAIITGDFNATPSDEPIRILLDQHNPAHFTNTEALSSTPHYGPEGTFNAFGKAPPTDQPIDYIFITRGFSVQKHATLSQSWKGHYSSDHFPVLAILRQP